VLHISACTLARQNWRNRASLGRTVRHGRLKSPTRRRAPAERNGAWAAPSTGSGTGNLKRQTGMPSFFALSAAPPRCGRGRRRARGRQRSPCCVLRRPCEHNRGGASPGRIHASRDEPPNSHQLQHNRELRPPKFSSSTALVMPCGEILTYKCRARQQWTLRCARDKHERQLLPVHLLQRQRRPA
jgi:hypothetical protein